MQTDIHIGSKAYSFMLAILPIMLMYKTPGLGFGFSTFLIAASMPFAAFLAVKGTNYVKSFIVLPLFLYFIYSFTKSDLQNVLLVIAILFHIVAICRGAANTKCLLEYIEKITILAAICVSIQQVYHLLTGSHICMLATGMMLDSLDQYKELALNSVSVSNGMYRPSCFFLEPSHFSQYCVIGLCSFLFRERPLIKKAIYTTIGILMSTSGMGFVLVFCVWGWWKITDNGRKTIAVGKIVKVSMAVVFLYVIMSHIPFFDSIISRFNGKSEDYNAIDGRLFFWDAYFKDDWTGMIFGFGTEKLPEVFFTGFMRQLYVYGWIGTILYFLFLTSLLINTRSLAKTLVIIYIGFLFIADLTGFIFIIFYFGVILSLYISDQRNEQICY